MLGSILFLICVTFKYNKEHPIFNLGYPKALKGRMWVNQSRCAKLVPAKAPESGCGRTAAGYCLKFLNVHAAKNGVANKVLHILEWR